MSPRDWSNLILTRDTLSIHRLFFSVCTNSTPLHVEPSEMTGLVCKTSFSRRNWRGGNHLQWLRWSTCPHLNQMDQCMLWNMTTKKKSNSSPRPTPEPWLTLGQRPKQPILKPAAVHHYNQNINDVDQFDRNIQPSGRWWTPALSTLWCCLPTF